MQMDTTNINLIALSNDSGCYSTAFQMTLFNEDKGKTKTQIQRQPINMFELIKCTNLTSRATIHFMQLIQKVVNNPFLIFSFSQHIDMFELIKCTSKTNRTNFPFHEWLRTNKQKTAPIALY